MVQHRPLDRPAPALRIRPGRQVNPLTIKMPSGIKLGRKDLARFEGKRANIATLIANLQKKTAITQR